MILLRKVALQLSPCKSLKMTSCGRIKIVFVAGFLTGLTKGWNLYECGKFANAVGC